MTTVGAWLDHHPDLERRDREVMLCHAAGLTRAQLISRPERALADGVAETLRTWAERRRRGEPVAYILGNREFWGFELEVSPAVLVPRPETELLVETALQSIISRGSGLSSGSGLPAATARIRIQETRVLELGTGSGAVAIALGLEARHRGFSVQVTATDVCPMALATAQRNGRRHGADVRWLHSDWFESVSGRYHLIVSNPPYVADDDPHLRDLGHEPALALTAGADGLDAIRAIAVAAPDYLEPGGELIVEHGSSQAAAVRGLLAAAGFSTPETLTDLAGLDRLTRGRLTGAAE